MAMQNVPECVLRRSPECSASSGSDGEFEQFLSRMKTPKSGTCCTPRTQSKRMNDSTEDFFSYFVSKYGSAKKEHMPKIPGLPGKEATGTTSVLPPLDFSDSDSDDDSVFVRSTPRAGPKGRQLGSQPPMWRSGHPASSQEGPTTARDGLASSASEGEGGATSKRPQARGAAKSWQPRTSPVLASSSSEEEVDSLAERVRKRMGFPPDRRGTNRKSTTALPPLSAPDALIPAQAPRKCKVLSDVTQSDLAQRRGSCQVKGCFLQELSNPDSQQSKHFRSKKEELAQKLYAFYNSSVFEQKLPEQMEILWNKKMQKTAGCCVTGQLKGPEGQRYARIMLSEKVCDSPDRLRDTLIHELCHAAAWLIHGIRDGHGRFWNLYAKKSVLIHPELPMVSRCHNYEIKYKFIYECSECKNTIGRHSKSLDTQRFVCALCKGQLVLCQTTRKDGTPAKTSLAPFAKYVKENYGCTKRSQQGLSHGAIMKKLSMDFAAQTSLLSP
ncbi:germ cell nuclear acidic protein [Pogona vitticeps]